MEARKEDYRNYLEETGVLEVLQKALVKLYETKNKKRPENAIAFLQRSMDETFPTLEEFHKLLKEVDMSRQRLADFDKKQAARNSDEDETDPNQAETPESDDTDEKKEAYQTAIIEAMGLLETHKNDDCESLLICHLTIDLFEELKDKRTSSGKTLLDCIYSGLKHPNSRVGIYAADAKAYDTFPDIFDPIIKEYHGVGDSFSQPEDVWTEWGDKQSVINLDSIKPYIKSTSVSCSRSLKKYPLSPSMRKEDYTKVMQTFRAITETLPDDCKVDFYPPEGDREKMIEDNQWFKSGVRYFEDAGALKFWPTGRGIFKNAADNFFVWVNEEDHLRFISTEQGGNIERTYNRLKGAMDAVKQKLKFHFDTRLGFLTFCPSNLGSAVRVSVTISLPNTKETIQARAKDNNLEIREIEGNYER